MNAQKDRRLYFHVEKKVYNKQVHLQYICHYLFPAYHANGNGAGR